MAEEKKNKSLVLYISFFMVTSAALVCPGATIWSNRCCDICAGSSPDPSRQRASAWACRRKGGFRCQSANCALLSAWNTMPALARAQRALLIARKTFCLKWRWKPLKTERPQQHLSSIQPAAGETSRQKHAHSQRSSAERRNKSFFFLLLPLLSPNPPVLTLAEGNVLLL